MIKTIGFLGCGNMGGAIARAVCKAADPQNVWLANRTAAKAEALAAELGCNTTINDEVAGRCDLIFLAVKPQMMEELLAPLRFTLAERPSRFVLCSMAAGLSIARIQEMAGSDCPVIRIMPNTPASVGAGMIQYCTSNVTAEEEAEFLKLMAPAGRLDAVPESLIDAASCVSGCGPAWVYQFIEALARYQKFSDIRNVGAAIHSMIESVTEKMDEVGFKDDEEWTYLTKIFGSNAIPAESAATITKAIKKAEKDGAITSKNRWQLIEMLATEYLAGK